MASTLTELEAINKVLRAVGEAPVTSADSQNPYAVSAKEIIKEKNKEVQSYGWWFNTQRDLTLKVDLQGYVSVPSNTLAITTDSNDGKLAVREDYLIDLQNNTNKFDSDVVVDIIEMVDFNYLPYIAANVITAYAAVEMQRSYEMEEARFKSLVQEYEMNLIDLKKQHLRNTNYNTLDTPQARRLLGGFRTGGVNPNIIGG